MPSFQPWIQEYVVSIAENFGADYFNAPRHEKPKTVQIIEFLNRGVEGQESNIWARVSDSACFIPVKFTPEAATEYERISGKRLAECQTAIVRIKNFRPFLGRIPIDQNKLTREETLALECTSVVIHGGFGENRIGYPKDVSTNPDVKLWIQGLRKGGGDGNVLKGRRIERESKSANMVGDKPAVPVLEQQKLDQVVCRPIIMQETRNSSTKPTTPEPPKTRKPSWKPAKFGLLEDITVDFEGLPIYNGEEITLPPSLKREKNDVEISASPFKKPRIDNGDEDSNPIEVDVEENDEQSSQPLTDWSVSDREYERRPTPPNETELKPPTVSQEISRELPVPRSSPLNSHKSPPSSLPPMSSYAKIEEPPSPSMSAPKLQPSRDPRSRVMRKVPPPKQPHELTQPSGIERILAPASDTSMSQSLSQSQSQSRRPRESHKPGSSPMRGLEGEDTRLVQETKETAQQDPNRQVARKTATSKQDTINGDGQQNKESHVGVKMRIKSANEVREADHEMSEELFSQAGRIGERKSEASVEKLRNEGWEVPPSKMGNNNNRHASPNGQQPVSNSIELETPVQHDPRTWSKPSFMEKQEGRRRLGGYTARLSGIRKGEELRSLLSWGGLVRVLEET